ncbi:hypothetical protein DFH07DRAFT_1067710 [Mycena maculata]|uniref:FAR-17a/AIG1-like protein n=1 Tax=Mycena maculata TaxID=230809 RepID=A0AAD7HHY6_9AGAR|nr:hypothetical protein DFH07DRAFT_1067710 [Mycena maculata]
MQSLSALLRLDPFDAHNTLVTSAFFSPSVLAAIRLAVAAYTFVTLVFSIVWGIVVTKDAAGFFSYFTHLTYCGICGYFFAAGIQTALYARYGQTTYPLQKWAKPWQFLHLALLSTITVFPILVSIVFWGILDTASTFDNAFDTWTAISVHLFNSVFALFEILLTNTPPAAWILHPLGLLILIGYTGIIYITYATQGFYAYAFMAPDGHPGRLALHILGVGLGHAVVFCFVHGIVLLRQKSVKRFLPASKTVASRTNTLDSNDKSVWNDSDIPAENASSKCEV